MKEDGRWDLFSKKEQSKQEKVYRKLQKNLGGLKTMAGLPGAIFIIDSSKETIAIAEARKMHIPIVAVVDTNGDPEDINYPIPGNDDAVRAIELFASKAAEVDHRRQEEPDQQGAPRGEGGRGRPKPPPRRRPRARPPKRAERNGKRISWRSRRIRSKSCASGPASA